MHPAEDMLTSLGILLIIASRLASLSHPLPALPDLAIVKAPCGMAIKAIRFTLADLLSCCRRAEDISSIFHDIFSMNASVLAPRVQKGK